MCTPRDLSKSALYLTELYREGGGMSEYERRAPFPHCCAAHGVGRGAPRPPRVVHLKTLRIWNGGLAPVRMAMSSPVDHQ